MGTSLFRAMKVAADGLPVCEDTARGLGVRLPPNPRPDIVPDESGRVAPGMGGMSVTPDDPARMNPLRRPRSLGGAGKDPLFVVDTDSIRASLTLRRDPRDPEVHGLVEPARVMPLGEYRDALSSTRPSWRPW